MPGPSSLYIRVNLESDNGCLEDWVFGDEHSIPSKRINIRQTAGGEACQPSLFPAYMARRRFTTVQQMAYYRITQMEPT